METIIEHNNRNYLLDTKKGQITFLDSRFYRDDEGNFLPSVTTILECYPKGAAYFQWLKSVGEDSDEIRDEAGRRGSRVHALTELYDQGSEIRLIDDKGNVNIKLGEWAMMERYVEFRNKVDFKIIFTEQTVISLDLGCAGTIDRIIELPSGKRILLDIKTSNAIYPSYWLQLAAYREMMENIGEGIDEVAILWLNAKTRTEGKNGAIQGKGWQLVTKADTAKDLNLFRATQKLWLAENEDMKPKEISYQLSYQLNNQTK